MAESSGLLNRRTAKSGTEGSNPSLSADRPETRLNRRFPAFFLPEIPRIAYVRLCLEMPGFTSETCSKRVPACSGFLVCLSRTVPAVRKRSRSLSGCSVPTLPEWKRPSLATLPSITMELRRQPNRRTAPHEKPSRPAGILGKRRPLAP